MEWELFLIIMGLLMGLCFIGVGICLGRLDKEQHKRADSLEHCLNGDDDHSNSVVGDIYRAEHSGQDTKRPTNRTGEE